MTDSGQTSRLLRAFVARTRRKLPALAKGRQVCRAVKSRTLQMAEQIGDGTKLVMAWSAGANMENLIGGRAGEATRKRSAMAS